MKVKLRVFFTPVEAEIEVPDNLDEDELQRVLDKKIYIEKTDEILNETVIEYYEEV